ncbi:MAG: alpha/beta hydrolase [Hydrogenophaga sp.]
MRRAVVLLALALVGCASLPDPAERRAAAQQLAQARGWQRLQLGGGAHALTAFGPPPMANTPGVERVLTVYIEGDGLAWLSTSRPSPDPTPVHPVALHLALAQPEGTAIYLARPCQYQDRAGTCTPKDWTSARFSEAAVSATDQALDHLLRHHQAQGLHLVGYSGGAAIAALVAARRIDVRSLTTVAGNLDHARWTRLHGLTPLAGSLNPAGVSASLSGLAQWHLVGANDPVIPVVLAQGFLALQHVGGQGSLRVLAGFDHRCCWAEAWPRLWRETR